MAHTYARLLLHLVFSTKGRRPLLDGALLERLVPYLGGVAKGVGASMLAANGAADHLHVLAGLPTSLAVADLARALKGGSSRWVHEIWPERRAFGWQEGYSAFSVSNSACANVEAYIARQQEHHRRSTFEDELRELLRLHGVEFDERYLWG